MSFLTAILLFGQVATSEGFQTQSNTATDPAAVQVDASTEPAVPQPPRAEAPGRPIRATVIDAEAPASLPAIRTESAVPAAEAKSESPQAATTAATHQVAASMFEQMLALDAQSQ